MKSRRRGSLTLVHIIADVKRIRGTTLPLRHTSRPNGCSQSHWRSGYLAKGVCRAEIFLADNPLIRSESTHVCTCVCIHVCMHVRTYVCMYVFFYLLSMLHYFGVILHAVIYMLIVCVYVYLYVYVYIYVCVCKYVRSSKHLGATTVLLCFYCTTTPPFL
jgi:hypothetical protein